MNKPYGFSLIELLAVIAIISIIASLAATAVGAAKSRANDVQCKNNLRNIGIYFHDESEYHGKFPSFIGGGGVIKFFSSRSFTNRSMWICKSDMEYINDGDKKKEYHSSYDIIVSLSGKLIDNLASKNPSIAYDNKPRHNGGRNAVFLDLRVSRLTSARSY